MIISMDDKIAVFRKMYYIRVFEDAIVLAVNEKKMKPAVYLSAGQEAVSAALSHVISDAQLFPQHRCHDIYLSWGGDPQKLLDELNNKPTGTSCGKVGSNCIQNFNENINMYGHIGLIGDNVPIAVGAAMGNKRLTICFFGDGAAEEDYIYPSLGFAATHKLPILFICIDNNLSVLTKKEVRRSWRLADVADGFGLYTADIIDNPWSVIESAVDALNNLPALINIHTCRKYWHVGVGIDNELERDMVKVVDTELATCGVDTTTIKSEIENEVKKLWKNQQ